MHTYKRGLACLCISLSLPAASFAWNALGHGVIANIAYTHLKPEVKNKVDNLVAYFHTEYPAMSTFPQAADWPDEVRAQRITTYTHWHYIDIPFSNDGTALKDVKDTDNAVWAINSIQDVVKNNKANPYEHARFLAFLAHIVGDLHQPLHTVTQFSHAHPDGDKGGNLYTVRYHGERRNLHYIWDQGLGAFAGDNSTEHVNELTDTLTAHYPETMFGDRVQDMNPEDWAKEGVENAKKYAYSTPAGQAPNEMYLENGQKIAEQQAALAGYRLAFMLNQLLG